MHFRKSNDVVMASEEEKKAPEAKISPGFAARLEQLKPEEKVRAIILLETGNSRAALKRRVTKKMREAAMKNARQSVAEVLPHIDRILKRHHGKRLKSDIDALGAVPIITTPVGIKALTASEHVKAIFEDQAVSRVA